MHIERIRQALKLFAMTSFFLLLSTSVVNAATPIKNEIQKLLAADGATSDQFGVSVALQHK